MECNCVRKITEGLLRKYSTLWQHRCEKSNNSVKKSIHLGRRSPKFWGPRLEPIGKSGTDLRDRPFNLQGGGYGYLFPSEFFFRTPRELEYFYFCRAKREFFFQNVTLGYMTKTLNQIIIFFLHQNQNIFSATLGIRLFFLEKTHSHSPPEVKWSVPKGPK
jgi:hypothetical protein